MTHVLVLATSLSTCNMLATNVLSGLQECLLWAAEMLGQWQFYAERMWRKSCSFHAQLQVFNYYYKLSRGAAS